MSQVKSRFAPKASTTRARATKHNNSPLPHDPVTGRPLAPDITSATWRDDMAAAGLYVPSSRQVLIGMVAGFTASFASSWAATSIVVWLSTAALVYSGSAFLALVVLVVGYIVAVLASIRIGTAVATFVFGCKPSNFTAAGAVIKDAAESKVSLVRGWFTRGDLVAA